MCNCLNVSESDIATALAEGAGVRDFDALQARLRCGTSCGSCVPEIRRMLADGKKAFYTTPLKALTNSKYLEFGEDFGTENVGILTGDRKENSDAPLIVGTTEIYRNQLFDALRSGERGRRVDGESREILPG